MNEKFIRERITQLRLSRDISEYQLSLDLGHSRGYINNITSGKTLPSKCEMLNICDYFNITPAEFFNEQIAYPSLLHEMNSIFPHLDYDSQLLILNLTKKLSFQK